MKRLIPLFAIPFIVASCAPAPADWATSADPLNTPGDTANVRYFDTDIHQRTFARDFGHPES